jgi:hypothetical protein
VTGASHKWKALPVQEKQVICLLHFFYGFSLTSKVIVKKKFFDQAKESLEKYKEDLKEWEVKMIIEHKDNLIRKSSKKALERRIKEKKVESSDNKSAKAATRKKKSVKTAKSTKKATRAKSLAQVTKTLKKRTAKGGKKRSKTIEKEQS